MAAHRYWRVRGVAVSGDTMSCAELEMRTSLGGADVTGSGTAIGDTDQVGFLKASAFDNNNSTAWASTNTAGDHWIGYDFGGSPQDILQMAYTARSGGSSTFNQSVTSPIFEYSDDGSTWTICGTLGVLTWTSAAQKVWDIQATGPMQFYQFAVDVVHDDVIPSPMRFYQFGIEVAHDDPPNQQVRLYNTHVEVIRMIADRYSPSFTPSEAQVFGGFSVYQAIGWKYIPSIGGVKGGFTLIPQPYTIEDRERNPYQTTRMALDEEEQQRILREQHNKTQAGDTTFDYGLLLKGTPEKLYNLGSMGRFYHEDYGVILARYVQFKDMATLDWQGVPVGSLKTDPGVNWVVTSNFDKSAPDLIMGVCCVAGTPIDGSYGWIIVNGAVPAFMRQNNPILPAPGAPFVWSATGFLDVGVEGRVLARRWGKADTPYLGHGSLYVEIEGTSPASINAMITALIEPINISIAALDARLDTAENTLVTHTGQISTLFAQDEELLLRIQREEQARLRDIKAVRNELGNVSWGGVILAGDNQVREEFAAADDELRGLVNAAQYRADAAYALNEGFSGAEFNEQLNGLNSQVVSLNNRLMNFTVDWSVPVEGQVLVSTSTIVGDATKWTFVGVDYKLVSLLDVDVTTPPADGDVLIYDIGTDTWIPGPMTGGGGGGAAWWFDPPAATSFSLVSGDATNLTLTDDSDTGLQVYAGASGSALRMAYRTLTTKTSDWELVMRASMFMLNQNFASCGIGLRDSVSGRIYRHSIANNIGLSVNRDTNLTTFSATQFSMLGIPGTVLPWFRVQFTGGNLVFSAGPDGKSWQTVYSESATAWLTNRADQVGIMMGANTMGPRMTIEHFELTGPGV